MPAFDFKCGRCGFVARYVGFGRSGQTTFGVEYVTQCEEAQAASARGANPLDVDCQYLNQALSQELSRHRQRRRV